MASQGKKVQRSIKSTPKLSVKNVQVEKDEHSIKCKDCSKDMSDNCKSMECDICKQWVCIECLELPESVFDTIHASAMPEFMIPCKNCRPALPTLVTITQSLKKNQLDSQQRFDKIDKTIADMEVNLTKSISEKVKKEIKKQVETKFKEQNSNLDKKILEVHERISSIEETQKNLASVSGEELGDKINSAVQEAMAEKMEIERRSKNVMVFQLAESVKLDVQARIQDDITSFKKVIKRFTNMELDDIQVEKAIRIGKKGGESPRPLKVMLENKEVKAKILKITKDTVVNTEFEHVRFAPDRTPTQRLKNKKLKEELFMRKSKGEDNLMIRNGKIIKVQVRTNGSDQNQEQENIQTEEEIERSQDMEVEANDLDSEEELDSDQEEGGSENQGQMPNSSFRQSPE